MLGDMIQMFRQQVSYTTQQSQGACTPPVQQEDKIRTLRESDLWTDFHEGLLVAASPTSH